MKLTHHIVAGLLSAGLLVAASAQANSQPAPAQNPVKFELPQVGSAPAAAPAAAPAPAPKFTEAQLMEVYGYMMGLRMGLAELEFTPGQIDAMARGMTLVAQGKEPGYDGKAIGPQLQEFLQKKQQAYLIKLRNANLAGAAEFFKKLNENKAIQSLDSGLRIESLKPGTGVAPKVGQIAKIHYTGSFINGQVFDSSVQGGEPAEILVQVATKDTPGAIAGMVEGLQKMAVGGKARLYIPPHLAYGDDGYQGIPPAATLIFEVELLEVKDAPKEAPAPAK